MGLLLWLKIETGGRKIPIPVFLPLVLILFMIIDILAFVPVTIYAIKRRDEWLLKVGTGFYLTRIILAFIVFGHRFGLRVVDGDTRIKIKYVI
jgi:hypothetical protein